MKNSLKFAQSYNSDIINPCHIKNTIQSSSDLAPIFGHLVENLPECKMKKKRVKKQYSKPEQIKNSETQN